LAQGEQRFTANQAGTRAVSFAYYGHGDPTCLIAEAGKQSCLTSVPRSTVEGKQLDNCDLFSVAGLTRVLAPSRDSLQQEADVVATLYRGLLVQGFASRQIAAECYFAFAPKKGKPKKVSPSYSQSGALPGYHACLGLGSRGMHERPDLCLFEPEVDGHFNLYRKGNRLKSYDARKLAALTVMAEVKGGATLQQSRDKTLVNKYRADITKLVTWRGLVGREVCQRDAQLPSVDFVMVAVDLRASPLDPRLTDALASEAQRQGVRFAYVHIPDM
jgi:hypothetical protein